MAAKPLAGGRVRGEAPVVDEPVGRQFKVLLVEASDEDADRFDLIVGEAAPEAFMVSRLTTVDEVATYLANATADCVVAALEGKDSDSLETIEKLVADAPGVAVIVLTSNDDDDDGVAIIEAGAADYLAKTTLDGAMLIHSMRLAMVRKRFDAALGEAQSIARVGSWEVDLLENRVHWSRELYRLCELERDHKPSWKALADRIHPADREATIEAVRRTMETQSPFIVDHRVVLPDAGLRWVRARGRVEVDNTGRPIRLLATAQDITEQKLAEEALRHQVLHNELTGLPNQVLLLDRVGQALQRLSRRPSTVGLIFLDVDQFNVINDSLGRAGGDQLLVALAAQLNGLIRVGDTLAQIGGDEFVVLCQGLADEAEAVHVCDRILESLTAPVAWEGGATVVSISAGIAFATSASVTPDGLLRHAEAAMFRAKSDGGARSAVYVATMQTKAAERLETEASLGRAIADGDLRLHYQPIVRLVDGHIIGHEALVRWEHPARGLLGPDQFITIAEESGLIIPLGAWVLREACRQAKQFRSLDPRWSHLTMSVNLSGRQFSQPDLVEVVSAALDAADLKPEDLHLEITESVLMENAASTTTILEALKDLGVRLEIDDFGTGFSSLAYLRRFPVDVLKIDRSFVSGIGTDLEDAAIVAAVVSLADALGLDVVAEGVETAVQRDCLIGLGCSSAQGYLFARPVDPAEAEQTLARASITAAPVISQFEQQDVVASPAVVLQQYESRISGNGGQGYGADRPNGGLTVGASTATAAPTIDLELRGAIANGELICHLQPIVDLRSGAIVGAEAFARWQHPTRGLLMPSQFMPSAHETSLVGAVDSWVLVAALAHVTGPSPASGVTVSVNTSGAALSDRAFASRVLRLLKACGLPPDALALVVTETAALVENESVRGNIDALRVEGVAIHLDDFGIGYSSLSHLAGLPIDAIKIDRSFVKAMVTDTNAANAVAVVTTAAHALGLLTVADGIESEAQAEALTACDVDCAQGDFYCPPCTLDEFARWMTTATH